MKKKTSFLLIISLATLPLSFSPVYAFLPIGAGSGGCGDISTIEVSSELTSKEKERVQYLEKIVDAADDPSSCRSELFELGKLHEFARGQGVTDNLKKAINYYREAGGTSAIEKLECAFKYGLDRESETDRDAYWAVAVDDIERLLFLSVSNNNSIAKEYLQTLADDGNKYAQLYVNTLMKADSYDTREMFFSTLYELSKNGDMGARSIISLLKEKYPVGDYYFGLLLENEAGAALAWEFYLKALARGYEEARDKFESATTQIKSIDEEIASLGKGFTQYGNDEDLLSLKCLAQELRIPAAEYELGILFQDGTGENNNMEESAKWLGKAARQGHERAQIQLVDQAIDGSEFAKNQLEQNNIIKSAQTKVSKADLDKSSELVTLAYDAAQRNDFVGAEMFARRALKSNPSNDEAYFILGGLYSDFKNEYEMSSWFYKKAILTNSKNGMAYFGLAGNFAKMGKWQKAKNALEYVYLYTSDDHPVRPAADNLCQILGGDACADKVNEKDQAMFETLVGVWSEMNCEIDEVYPSCPELILKEGGTGSTRFEECMTKECEIKSYDHKWEVSSELLYIYPVSSRSKHIAYKFLQVSNKSITLMDLDNGGLTEYKRVSESRF